MCRRICKFGVFFLAGSVLSGNRFRFINQRGVFKGQWSGEPGGKCRYLISPLVAGLLLSVSDVKLLLILDISTFAFTVAATAVVKRGIETKPCEKEKSFIESLKEGWDAVHEKKGIFLLILVSAAMTLFLGIFQILAEPLILSFADSKTLGIGETVCASGMLCSSLILGMRGIKSIQDLEE